MSAAVDVVARRGDLLADTALTGLGLRAALGALYDDWITHLLGDPGPGVCLVAVGGMGRGELAPASDLDLVLLHDPARDVAEVAQIADRVWYPIWDAGVGLDHSVRTPEQALEVARDDLKAALGLLDVRHVAGDTEVSAAVLSGARAQWRRDAHKRLPQLRAAVQERAASEGEVAFLLEPDLKEARGGLRDVHALQAIAAAQVADPPSAEVREAATVLLDARGELHRRTATAGRRVVDRLLMQEQDAVAAALAYDDADALMRSVSEAGRAIAYASDTTWRRALPSPQQRSFFARRRKGPERVPLAQDVVAHNGEVVLARGARPEADAVLPLRVARAAASADLPIAPGTLESLARRCPALPDPWPKEALEAFVGLLAAGRPMVRVVESLDRSGLLARLLPEWSHTRSCPQRNSYHRFTVDRHLLEAAAHAASLTRQVDRPDLLLLGALFHDIGKGLPGDHSEVGAQILGQLGPRLGLAPADVATLQTMVLQHLLLSEAATRRDLYDPATTELVAERVGSIAVLELLHALTEADSKATGPAAWSSWKAGLLTRLVRLTAATLQGAPPPEVPPLADWQEQLVQAGTLGLAAHEDEVAVVAPDAPGVLSMAAGLMALHRLDVRSAHVETRPAADGSPLAVVILRVSPRFGSMPDWSVVTKELRLAAAGDLDVADKLRQREAAYDRAAPEEPAPPRVWLLDEASDLCTVVEVRAPDTLGVLHRITGALGACGLNVRSAHVSTVGADAIDAFYVVGADELPVTDTALRSQIVDEVLAVIR